MKILHTSDWHIGRRFEREPMEDAQRAFLAWLAEITRELGVDLVIVAGDVYDRSLPAEDAVALLDEGLNALRDAGAEVALISGNHDSARRLGFGATRQASGGVHVFADEHHAPVPWVFEAAGESVAVLAVPFLDPLSVAAPAPGPDGSARPRTHENVLVDALRAGRARLDGFEAMPRIAVAHAFVSGASVSESERPLSIGGTDQVDVEVFAGFDYVALGHLHRPQRVGGRDHVVYSGSPLPYSFSEDHAKSVRLLTVQDGAIGEVTEIAVPVGRPVARITGELDVILADPAHDSLVDHWISVTLTDETAQSQPLERLKARFPHAVHVRYERSGGSGSLGGPSTGSPLHERPTEELVFEFLESLRDRAATEEEASLILDAVAAATKATQG